MPIEPPSIPASGAPAAAFRRPLAAAYRLAETSRHLFASPLGPFSFGRRRAWLPRFVFFGPAASDDSWRLAFLSGFDQRDPRPTAAALGLIERLEGDAEAGHGLNLAFFPVVDAAGAFFGGPDRGLAAHHWGRSPEPEIALLEREARQRAYHGFIRIEPAFAGEERPALRLWGPDPHGFVSEIVRNAIAGCGGAARFEDDAVGTMPLAGPLSMADDLPFPPFELSLRLPLGWTSERCVQTAGKLLQGFLEGYRAFQAHAQHL